MIPVEVVSVLPPEGGTASDQARECLWRLRGELEGHMLGERNVFALTFFVDAVDPETYSVRAEEVGAAVREIFDEAPPPWSVIAQAPEGERLVAMEAAAVTVPVAGMEVERRSRDGLAYTVASLRGMRVVYGAGLAAGDRAGGTEALAREAFAKMEAVLLGEDLSFGHVVRQWNYVEGVLGTPGYQALNDVRSIAYSRSEFPNGYPAATGIGQAAGGVVLEFIAVEAPPGVRVKPVANPRQIDAHRYSEEVLEGRPVAGLSEKAAPKFERGKLLEDHESRVVFVSGTASILGEKSVAPGDVEEQTRITIENIESVAGESSLSHLRAYVKRAEDIPAVRRICEAAYGPVPALYVVADVCRDELLVEIEGALRQPRIEP